MVFTLVWDETGVVLRGGFRGAVLVWGVLILGDTYDRGDEASDVRDIGDWLDCWATPRKRRETKRRKIKQLIFMPCLWFVTILMHLSFINNCRWLLGFIVDALKASGQTSLLVQSDWVLEHGQNLNLTSINSKKWPFPPTHQLKANQLYTVYSKLS